MKFQISSKTLQHALSVVGKVIQKKNALAILDYAMVSKHDDCFFITGASTDNQLQMAFDIRQTEGDSFTPFCLDVSQLLALLATLPEQPLEIIVDESRNFLTTVLYSDGDFQLSSLAADAFPVQDAVSDGNMSFCIPSSVLLPTMKKAMVCCKDDQLRPVLGGILLDVNNEGVTFVATDSGSLFRYIYNHGAPFLSSGSPSQIVIHRSLVSAIDSAFAKDEHVNIKCDGHRAELYSDSLVLTARVLEGKFPNYNRVMLASTPYHVVVGVSALALAAKRISIAASATTDMIVLQKKEGQMCLSSEDLDFNRSAKAVLPVSESTLPDGFRIGMKGERVLSLLSNVSTDTVCICLTAPDKAIVMREDDASSPLTELFMPILCS